MPFLGTYSSASIRGWSAGGGGGRYGNWSLLAQLDDTLTSVGYANGVIMTGNAGNAKNPDGIVYWYDFSSWRNHPDRDQNYTQGAFQVTSYANEILAYTGYDAVYDNVRQSYSINAEYVTVSSNQLVFGAFIATQSSTERVPRLSLWRNVKDYTFYTYWLRRDNATGGSTYLREIGNSQSFTVTYPVRDHGVSNEFYFTGITYFEKTGRYYAAFGCPGDFQNVYSTTTPTNTNSWTSQRINNFTIIDVDSSPTRMVFVGLISSNSARTVYYSDNGTTFFQVPNPPVNGLSKIRYINNQFYALSPVGLLYSSVDGVSWIEQQTGETDITDFASVNDTNVVAVTSSGKVLIT